MGAFFIHWKIMKLNLVAILLLSNICFAKGLDPDVIRKVLMGNVPMMKKCYQDKLKESGRAFGFTPILHFKINSAGNVQSSKIEVKDKSNDKIVLATSDCVNGVLKSIKFPKPIGGGLVEVNQPLNFKPTKGNK